MDEIVEGSHDEIKTLKTMLMKMHSVGEVWRMNKGNYLSGEMK